MDLNDILKNFLEGSSINISIKVISPDQKQIDETDYELIYNDVITDPKEKTVNFLMYCPNTKKLFFRIINEFLEVFDDDILILRKKIKNHQRYIRVCSKLNNNTLLISLY